MNRLRGIVVLAACAALSARSMPVADAAESERLACLTDARAVARPSPARPSFLYVAAEERRPLASGTKVVLVRGDVPSPGAEALSRVVDEGYRQVVSELGFGGFPDRISVSFADLGPEAEGYVVMSARGSAADIVLSRALAGGPLVRALAHQVGHLAVLPFGDPPQNGLGEATASWIETRIAHAEQAGRGRGAVAPMWLEYLDTRFGHDVVRAIWEETASTLPDEVMRATDTVLASRGTSARTELDSFAAWLFAEHRRRTILGRDTVPIALATDAETFPAAGRVVSRPDPIGVTYLRLRTADVAGGLRVELIPEGGTVLAASALLVAGGSTVPSARVRVAAGPGRPEIAVPVTGIDEVVVAVVTSGSGPGAFSFLATTDDTFPYVLSRLDATADRRGVRLFWETTSESSIQGWSILRSDSPGQPFAPLNVVLVPGAETLGLEGGSEYAFLDRDVESGRTYAYYVEALTQDGLAGPSHIISLTLP